MVILILIAPQPSFIIIIVSYHIRTRHDPLFAFIHVLVVYTLTFLTCSSLLVCVTRDPGSTKGSLHSKPNGERDDAAGSDEELSHLVIADGEQEEAEMSLAEVLAAVRTGETTRKPRWCKKCMVRFPPPFVHAVLHPFRHRNPNAPTIAQRADGVHSKWVSSAKPVLWRPHYSFSFLFRPPLSLASINVHRMPH